MPIGRNTEGSFSVVSSSHASKILVWHATRAAGIYTVHNASHACHVYFIYYVSNQLMTTDNSPMPNCFDANPKLSLTFCDAYFLISFSYSPVISSFQPPLSPMSRPSSSASRKAVLAPTPPAKHQTLLLFGAKTYLESSHVQHPP